MIIRRSYLLFAFSVLLFTSCREYSPYQYLQSNSVAIGVNNLQIVKSKIIDWQVGIGSKNLISKGVTITLTLPILQSQDLSDLLEKRGANAWLLRLSRDTAQGRRVVGKIYVPLTSADNTRRTSLKISQLSPITIAVHYAAAAISQRFENFACPAFGHQRVISGVTISRPGTKSSDLIVSSISYHSSREGNIEKYSFRTPVLNGGETLQGSYLLEVAAYNYQEKRLKSNYSEYTQRLDIGPEMQRPLKGCSNFTIPPAPVEEKGLRQFKFGGGQGPEN